MKDVERFAISREYALGLHLFLESVRAWRAAAEMGQGQVPGPFSFAMTVTDETSGRWPTTPNWYEVAVQGMAMKARWVARRLR